MDSWIVVEWELDVQNTLKDVALPVHLLRQVPKSIFFRHFSHLFLDVVFYRFLIDFGGVLGGFWRPKWSQNRCKIELKSRSQKVSIFSSFFFEVERFES